MGVVAAIYVLYTIFHPGAKIEALHFILYGVLGNWEATAQFMALQGRPLSFVAREQENPYLEAEVRRIMAQQ